MQDYEDIETVRELINSILLADSGFGSAIQDPGPPIDTYDEELEIVQVTTAYQVRGK